MCRAADLPPRTLCAAVCLVGSSTALGERLPTGNEPVQVIRGLERRLGQEIGAVVALNLDAESALLPVITAALLDIPLVDGDGSGRVFPLLNQSTYTLGGVSVTPLVMAGPADDVVVLDTGPDRVEELIRPLVLALGGWTVTACYPMTAEVLARVVVPGTVSRLMEAGVPGAPRSIAAPYGVRTLCRGRIAAVETSTGHGMDLTLPSLPSSIVVEEKEGLGRLIRLEAHNEIVFALVDGAMAAMAPDQICMISTVDGMAVDVDKAVPGLEVEVMVVRRRRCGTPGKASRWEDCGRSGCRCDGGRARRRRTGGGAVIESRGRRDWEVPVTVAELVNGGRWPGPGCGARGRTRCARSGSSTT
ncbi:DUF917 domain-containing protein [Streptosporangium lutulentum]